MAERLLSLHGSSAKQTLRTLHRQPSFSRVRGVHSHEVAALEAACSYNHCSSDTEEAEEEEVIDDCVSVRSGASSIGARSTSPAPWQGNDALMA